MTGKRGGRQPAARRQSAAKGKQKQTSEGQASGAAGADPEGPQSLPQTYNQRILGPPSATAGPSSAPKVPIPRLPNEGAKAPPKVALPGEKLRVNHACVQCRQRKTKCTGERPSCRHCLEVGVECRYADGKRDTFKKEFGQMARKIEIYEQLLREAGAADRLSHEAWARFQEAATRDDDDMEYNTTQSPRKSVHSMTDSESEDNESQDSARRSLRSNVGRGPDEFVLESTSTGYVGKVSDITWIRQLEDQIEYDDLHPVPNSATGSSLTDEATSNPLDRDRAGKQRLMQDLSAKEWSYHLDDQDLPDYKEVHVYDEEPPQERIDFLLQTYFKYAHPGFPIISQIEFTQDVKDHIANNLQGGMVQQGGTWFAALNLVFAIAAQCAYIAQLDITEDDMDHALFFARARVYLNGADSILQRPDLLLVQTFGLMAFYLTASGQVNRAWYVNGIAMRFAIALGLHVRLRTEEVSDFNQQCRYKAWWSLYSLGRLLANMTGRPETISLNQFNTPLPLPIEEHLLTRSDVHEQEKEASAQSQRRISIEQAAQVREDYVLPPRLDAITASDRVKKGMESLNMIQPSSPLCFRCRIHLDLITHEIVTDLYRTTRRRNFWASIQAEIVTLNSKLDVWFTALPPAFNFTRTQSDRRFVREIQSLGFSYYSTKMILHKPCLCRPLKPIPAGKLRDVFYSIAASCVQAALDMLNLLPNSTFGPNLYTIAPWWCLVHHLMQATTVLLSELFFQGEHLPGGNPIPALQGAQKAILWLHRLARESLVARRAWVRANALLRKLAPRIGATIEDMPTEPPPLREAPSTLPRWSVVRRDAATGTGPMQGMPQSQGSAMHPTSPMEAMHTFGPYDPSLVPYGSMDSTIPSLHGQSDADARGGLPTSATQNPEEYGYYGGPQSWERMDGPEMGDEHMGD